MSDIRDLSALIRSHTPLIIIDTNEEKRVVELISRVADQADLPCFSWTLTEGLLRMAEGYKPQRHNMKPLDMLGNIKSGRQAGIYLLLDLQHHLDTPTNVRLLKELILEADQSQQTIILCGYQLDLPAELTSLATRYDLSPPTTEQLKTLLHLEMQHWSHSNGGRDAKIEGDSFEQLVQNLNGLSEAEAKRIIRRAIFDDGALTASDMDVALKKKYELLSKNGVLTLHHDTAEFADVGGLSRLKSWLDKRKPVFTGKASLPGLPAPKGLLLLGVQGCGKSLAAKAVAGCWNAPLLHLDFGALYNKYYGETERNLRESLQVAQAMRPCILWLDELEKGMSTGNDESGTARRILGSFLTWMAEREPGVFLVATANDIEALPPELIRKGRFDELFFIDLPNESARSHIFTIHLERRGFNPDVFAIDDLARASDGFSGSEIEEAVIAALYSTLGGSGQLTTELLLKELDNTRPLSVIMADRIAALRSWAAQRTVPAN